MPTALPSASKIYCLLSVEEHDGFRCQSTVLGSTETKNVNSHFPGQLCWAAVEPSHSVGEPSAVNMQGGAMRSREIGQLGDLLRAVYQTAFARLCHADRARSYTVGRISGQTLDGSSESVRREFTGCVHRRQPS